MNNIDTLTALCELNPECLTLADMLTDALMEERDELPTEARKKVDDLRTRTIDARNFDAGAALMALGKKYKREAMARIREHVGGLPAGTLVVVVTGDRAPSFTAHPHDDVNAGLTIEPSCLVGANWLLARVPYVYAARARKLAEKSRVRDCRYRV